LSGREDLNLRPFGPESGPEPSQGERTDAKSAQSLQTEGGGESSDSQDLRGFPKDFSTRFLPEPGATAAHGGAQAGGVGGRGPREQKTPRARSTAATLADLRVLWGGRDRLLKVREVAEVLGVCNATVYRLCEGGELACVWVVNAIRIRPADLEAFIAASRRKP
jgi:excisionase family DNA binding protein